MFLMLQSDSVPHSLSLTLSLSLIYIYISKERRREKKDRRDKVGGIGIFFSRDSGCHPLD